MYRNYLKDQSVEIIKIKPHFKKEPFEEYLAHPCLSSHALIELGRSPAHYFEKYHLGYRPTSPSLEFGTLAHLAVLEPEVLKAKVVLQPDMDRRTKEGKAMYAAFQATHKDKIAIDHETFVALERVQQNATSHPVLKNLLQGGAAEMSGYFTELNYDIPCKIRPDYLREGVLVDLKTAKDASLSAFQRSIATYGYAVQAAFYLDAVALITATPADDISFIFAVIENSPPYAIALYVADPDMIKHGRRLYRDAMSKYLECHTKKEWPGYPTEIKAISLPPWALYS